jgi:hypothetical protein
MESRIDEPDDDILGLDEVLNSIATQLKGLSDKIDKLEKALSFLTEKTDGIGKKVYWINKLLEEKK